MFDFAPDETFLFFAMLAASCVTGFKYYRPLFTMTWLGKRKRIRLSLAVCPVIGMAITLAVLQTWSDSQVRGHLDYILFFLFGCAAWQGVAAWGLSMVGISALDDALERDNPAAAMAVSGTLLAVSIIYALANVGTGPTIETTLLPAAAGAVALAVAYLIIVNLGGVVEDITVGRDTGAGIRLAGALAGAALILGRAVGGNFVSWDETWIDLAKYGWPSLALGAMAGRGHQALRSFRADSSSSISLLDMAFAVACIFAGLSAVALTPHGLNPSKW